MRASRLLSLLLLLQNRGRMTAAQLAEALEVSVRTVYRDVEALSAAGVPLYGEGGHAGGYQLLGGYRTRLTGLTADEAESLFLTGLPGPAAELGLGAVVAAAQLKLLAALPPELRDRAGRITARFHLDAPGWYSDGAPPFLAAVAEAVWNGRAIWVRYRRWRAPEVVERTLHPYGVVLKAGTWYLVARGREHLATYKVAEILDLRPTDEAVERPADFDLAAYWQAYLDDYLARQYRDEAVLALTARGLARLRHLMPRPVWERAAATAEGPDAEGRTTATIPIESVDHALGELLRLGPEVEVLAPEALRARHRSAAEAMAARYAGT